MFILQDLVKKVITEALGERAVRIIQQTDSIAIARNRRKSDEQKSLMEKRSIIKARVGRLYRQLVQELFPDMSVSLVEMLMDENKVAEENDRKPSAVDEEKKEITENDGSECPVCYEKETDNNEFVYTNPCVHFFCYKCIRQHVKVNGKQCPVCRDSLESLVKEGIQYPFKEPTKDQLKDIYVQQVKVQKEKTRVAEKHKVELETEIAALRFQLEAKNNQNITVEEVKHDSTEEVDHESNTEPQQETRPPRKAFSNNPPGHRLQPHDRYFTPESATLALLKVIAPDLVRLVKGNSFFLITKRFY